MSGFSLSTSLRLSQQQKLSPQMLQSINILALPVEELRERIFEEVEKNKKPLAKSEHICYNILYDLLGLRSRHSSA